MERYHCDNWHRDLTPAELNEQTIEEAYDESACLDFSATRDVDISATGTWDTHSLGDGDAPESVNCNQHWRTSYWSEDAYENAYDDLSNRRDLARVWICDDCGDNDRSRTIWESERAYQRHSNDEHETGFILDAEQETIDFDEIEGHPDAPANRPTPPPATRIPADRVVIEVARGRIWFTNIRLPEWVPPMIDQYIAAGRISNIENVGRYATPRPAVPTGVMYRERPNNVREIILRGESRTFFNNPANWDDEWTRVELFATPPVRTTHSLFPGGES